MHLVKDWKKAPRMYSIWALSTIALLQGYVLPNVPPDILALPLPFYPAWTWDRVGQMVTMVLAISGAAGRLISQDLGEE